jgi:glucokinase
VPFAQVTPLWPAGRMTGTPVVLGLDFGGTKTAMAVSTPTGERLASREVGSGAGSGARSAFDRGVAAARDLVARTAGDAGLLAVGAATFGIPFEDHVEPAPAIPGWEDLAFGRELRAAFPAAEVVVTTDVKAAAAAEARWGALRGCDPALYLNPPDLVLARYPHDAPLVVACQAAGQSAGQEAGNRRTPV